MSPPLPREIRFAKKSAAPLDARLKTAALEAVQAVIIKARHLYQVVLPMPTVSFDLRGMTAGKAFYQQNHIQLNPVLFAENRDSFVSDTIPHEVAHLVARRVHGAGIQAHGKEWQAVMQRFGCDPKRTHNYDVANARTTRMVTYTCRCGDHPLSIRKHNKAKRGEVTYSCRKCGQRLQEKTAPNRAMPARPVAPAAPPHPMPATMPGLQPPTARMLAYAQALARDAGVPLPEHVPLSFVLCQAFIEELKQQVALPAVAQPTEKQLTFARDLARRKGLPLPPELLKNRQKLSQWLTANR